MAARIWQQYLHLLKTRPLITKCGTTGSLMGVGDGIAQTLEGRNKWDWKRTLRTGGVGFCLSGPGMHFWYKILDRLFTSHSTVTSLKKLAMDQLGFAPFAISSFFFALHLSAGQSMNETTEKLKHDFIPTMKANYMLWPAANFINFQFVPLHHRVLYSNVISLAWSTYLAHVGNRNEKVRSTGPGVSVEEVVPDESQVSASNNRNYMESFRGETEEMTS
eukprot:gb/GECH01014753.1/.p1 GENE.gb/GECH01014753.1/~~gb/GECH01014753.1/.p1  ORF type:complete len:219 (+),score=25.98 gb/GECH01014753.1/:1-657(+)